jgi:hypothetical protein
VLPLRDGTYAAHFRTTAAGRYTARVSLHGVAGSASSFVVLPGTAAAAASHAQGAGLRSAVAGDPAFVHIYVRPAPQPRASVYSSAGGELQSVATPQPARGWAHPSCSHFKNPILLLSWVSFRGGGFPNPARAIALPP